MKKFDKKIYFILLFIMANSLFAQDLDSKKEKLEELREQIQKQEELIQQSKDNKERSQADLKEFKLKKKANADKLKKLKKSEASAKKTLLETETEIKETVNRIGGLDGLCRQEYLKLFQAHYSAKIFPKRKYDGRLLAALLLHTVEKMELYENAKSGLEDDKKKHNRDYENLIWSRIVEKKRGNKYSDKMKSLESDITRLDRAGKDAVAIHEELQKAAKEMNKLIVRLQSKLTAKDYSFKFSSERLIWPIKGEVLQNFGEQPTDRYKVSVQNNGIDIAATEGTEVHAVDDGVVAFAQWYSGAGKLVIIDHKNGFFSLYSHNSSLLVAKGDSILKNQKIALSGSSGSAEKPFLHFELRKRGKPVDPLNYLE